MTKHTEESTETHACDCKTNERTHACDCISRQAAEAIFRNAKKSLYEQSRKGKIEYKEFQIREMMLLNAEQFIHLLPSVEPEKCDDCISRQGVLREFTCLSDDAFVINSTIQKIVKNLPPVEPGRESGKWIENDTIRQCNMCRALYPKGQRCGAYHYCPNCGAKMEE